MSWRPDAVFAAGMVIQLPYEPVTLDPASAEDGVGFRVLSLLNRGLMRYDARGKLQLGLASEHRPDPTRGRHYFKLRENLKWSDGVPVEAEHFVYGIQRALDPKRLSKLSTLLFFIRGAREYKNGQLADFSKVGVRALSKSEIAFELEKGFGVFPHVLALAVSSPFRKDLEEPARKMRSLATTGPYFLQQLTHDVRIQCARNPYFQDPEKTAPDSVAFEIVPDDSTARSLFEQGRIDVLTKLNPLELDYWKKSARVLELPYAGIYYFAFDVRPRNWDLAARERVASAVDRESIARSVDAVDSVARNWMHPQFEPSPGCCRGSILPRSSAAKVPPKIRLAYDANSRNQLVAERMQQDLKKKLGMDVELVSRDWKGYLTTLVSGGFESKDRPLLYRMGWLLPILDAYGQFLLFHSSSMYNYSGWSSPRSDALIDELGMLDTVSKKNVKRRVEISNQLLKEIDENRVFLPIYYYTQQYVLGSKVRGFTANPLGQIFFF